MKIDLRVKLNANRQVHNSAEQSTDLDIAVEPADQSATEPGSERSLQDRSGLDNSVEILEEIPTPSPMLSLMNLGEPTKADSDLRRKLNMLASSKTSNDSIMETDKGEDDDDVTILNQINWQDAVVMGASFRKIALSKVREAVLNILNLRLEEDLSDGNLSDSLVMDEYPENSNQKTKKILEQMAKKLLPEDIYVSDDVLALLDNTNDEVKELTEEAPPLTPPVRPEPVTVIVSETESVGGSGNTENGAMGNDTTNKPKDVVKFIWQNNLILLNPYVILTTFLIMSTGSHAPRPVRSILRGILGMRR